MGTPAFFVQELESPLLFRFSTTKIGLSRLLV